ncbi:MAG TPA: DUF1499 domain-containing protein [Methyloceanibacter sp.]|nr:DUF1499 domain-containing protein [Methyloceanibacter sp.]
MSYTMAHYATARYPVKEAREATWAKRIALFFVQLLILTAVLHHFATLTTPAAINLLFVSIGGLFLAILIATASLVRIWFGGQTGAGQAFAAIFIACIGLAAPLYFASQAIIKPRLNDVQTNPAEPIAFKTLSTLRPADANPIRDPDEAAIEMQEQAYPDLAPMALERSATEVFSLVHEAVERLGWTIVSSEAPGEAEPGRIEATDRTLVMGFTDDVVVRVKGDDTYAVIDARSVSRYGWHDLGANADRIRNLFAEIATALEKGEKTVLEQAAPKDDAKDKKDVTKKPVKKSANKKRRARQ